MNRLFQKILNKPFHYLIYFIISTPIIVMGIIALGNQVKLSKEKNVVEEKFDAGMATKSDLIQRVTIAGSINPFRRTLVSAPYNGYVKKIFVKIGDQIKKGDPIVSIAQSLQDTEPVYPLRAPYPGIVVQVEKSEGEFVREGDPKDFIIRIDDLSKLFVVANAPEIDRVKLKVGQEAIIKASAILNRSYKGIIKELALAAKEKEQWGRGQVEFSIKVEILNPDSHLAPGMSSVIDIITNKKENVLTLRHEFIHRKSGKYFVILKSGEKKVIEVGLSNEEVFEITKGLKEGEVAQQIDFSTLIRNED